MFFWYPFIHGRQPGHFDSGSVLILVFLVSFYTANVPQHVIELIGLNPCFFGILLYISIFQSTTRFMCVLILVFLVSFYTGSVRNIDGAENVLILVFLVSFYTSGPFCHDMAENKVLILVFLVSFYTHSTTFRNFSGMS